MAVCDRADRALNAKASLLKQPINLSLYLNENVLKCVQEVVEKVPEVMKSAEFKPSETPELWAKSEVVLVAEKVLPNTPILPSPLRSTQRKHTRRALSYGQNGRRFLGPERTLNGKYPSYSPASFP